jgi:hypothetical protein
LSFCTAALPLNEIFELLSFCIFNCFSGRFAQKKGRLGVDAPRAMSICRGGCTKPGEPQGNFKRIERKRNRVEAAARVQEYKAHAGGALLA